MSYVGNTPALKYIDISVQHFTTSATASYTLDESVSNENEIALFINNVRQQPGGSYAYTASGTALTLSSPTAGTDTMYCIFIGKAIGTNTPPAGSVNTSELVDLAVSTAKVQSDAITYDKIQDLGTANRVLGGSTTGTVGEVQITDSMSNFVSTSSASGLQIKGDNTTAGTLQLNCEQNTHGVKIKSPAHSSAADYTLTLPTTDGNTSEFLQTNGSGVLTWAEPGGGITSAQEFRLQADQVGSNSAGTVLTNWGENNTDYQAIGSNWSQSSGIFSCSATGIYSLAWLLNIAGASANDAFDSCIEISTDTGSSYTSRAKSWGYVTSAPYAAAVGNTFIFDVSNTSTFRLRFKESATNEIANTSTIKGSSTESVTNMTFVRLGDT